MKCPKCGGESSFYNTSYNGRDYYICCNCKTHYSLPTVRRGGKMIKLNEANEALKKIYLDVVAKNIVPEEKQQYQNPRNEGWNKLNEEIRKQNWDEGENGLYEIIKNYEQNDLAALAVNYFHDLCTKRIESEILKAEKEALRKQLENSVQLPCIPYLTDLYVLDHSDKKGNYIKKCQFTHYVIAPHPIRKGEFEGDIMYMNEKHKNEGRDIKEIGKTIFFDEQQAEAKLKELEEENV